MDSKLPAKKRSHEEAIDDTHSEDFPSEQEVAAMSRSERKRHREKKRRNDVNKGFDELMSLLLEIDPEVRADAEERASKGQCKRSLGSHEDNVLSRVDLISTAVKVLRRVHGENEKHKKIVEELLRGGGSSGAPAAGLDSDSLVRSVGGLGGGGGAASHQGLESQLRGAPSWADRQSFLSNVGLAGLGGNSSAQAWENAQLRAMQASRLSALSHMSGGYQGLDLFSARASAAGLPSASDHAFLSQLSNNSAMKRSLLQSMMNQDAPPGNRAMTEALYASASFRDREGGTDAPGKK